MRYIQTSLRMNKIFTTTKYLQKSENCCNAVFSRKTNSRVVEKTFHNHCYVIFTSAKNSFSNIIDFYNPCLFKINEIHSIYAVHEIGLAHAY